MLVSVFIPTYNAQNCIDATLTSVLQQTHADLEVWIVDDCSSDDTIQKLQQWQQRDNRVHVLTKEHNEGFVPYSWVRVLPLLQGEFTLYLSHDDYLAPDCIEQLVQAQRETGVDAVIPDVVFVQESDGSERHSFSDGENQTITARQAFSRMLNYDIPGFALWRTSMIHQVGMPTEAWNSDEGMQRLWALHCVQGIALCPSARFYYFITSSSITKGLKPYHVKGLLTQRRLLRAALRIGLCFTAPRNFSRFAWQYLKSAIYLRRKLGRCIALPDAPM